MKSAPADESAASPYGTKWTRWIKPIILSLLLIFFDELGVYAFLIGIFLILVYLPRSLRAKKYASCRRERLIRFSVYLTAVGVVLTLIPINRQVSKGRAELIIVAVESYKAANGKYPDSLDRLVPQFIAEIPTQARISFFDRGFRYFVRSYDEGSELKESHTLMYVTMPPFGRATYNFERKSWGFID